MWRLYRNLDSPDLGMEKYLIDEIIEVLKTLPPQNLLSSIKMLYKDIPTNPLQFGIALSKGLIDTRFFEFNQFIRSLDGRSKSRNS